MPSNQAVVFDFGGVLMDWDPRYLYRKYFGGDYKAMESFFGEIGFAEWNRLFDAGRPFAEGIAELTRRFPARRELIRAYDERWEETLAGPIEPTVAILGDLRGAGNALYALSNWSAEKFALVRNKYEFFSWFDEIVISGEVGLTKPDRRIFEALIARIGRTASECLFVDDAERNIAAAKIGETYPRPRGNRYLFVRKDSAYIRDRFEHELLLVLLQRPNPPLPFVSPLPPSG